MTTLKNPTAWLPQPLGYGSVTATAALNLVTQTGAQLTTQSGTALITGTQIVKSQKIPIVWSNTGA